MIIWIITAMWILLGCCEIAHLISLFTNRSLDTFWQINSVMAPVAVLVCAGIYVAKNKKKKPVMKIKFSPYMGAFVGIMILTLMHYMQAYVPDLQDAVYEIAIGNVESGYIMQTHPFIGAETESMMPLRMQILGLPSIYAAISRVSGIPLKVVVCTMIPMLVFCSTMMMYYVIASELYQNSHHKKWLFMTAVILVIWLTGGSEELIGYRILYAGFSGETIRAALLIPYTFYAAWKNRWFLVALGILAELCLVWTTYGVGYCMLIAICMLCINYILKWRAEHANRME